MFQNINALKIEDINLNLVILVLATVLITVSKFPTETLSKERKDDFAQ